MVYANNSTNGKGGRSGGFNLLDHLDKLEPSKGGKYFCPVCGGNDFSVAKTGADAGAYTCHNNGCTGKVVRDTIAPLTKEARQKFAAEKARPKSVKEKGREAQVNAAIIKHQVEDLTRDILDGRSTIGEAQVSLDAWCKEMEHNSFSARTLLNEAIDVIRSTGVKLHGDGKSGGWLQEKIEGGSIAPQSTAEVVAALEKIFDEGLDDWLEENHLALLKPQSGMTDKAFQTLVAALRSRREIGEALQRRAIGVIPVIDLADVLPKSIADMMKYDGRKLGIDPVMILQYLMGTLPAFLHKDTRLDIKGHTVPAVIWTAVVAKSGRGKSRAEGLICDRIRHLQADSVKGYKSAKSEYDKAEKRARKSGDDNFEETCEPPALPRKYAIEVATIQKVVTALSEQLEYGSTWIRDELAGIFKSLDQFAKGSHEGGEILLSLWDCKTVIWDRVDADKSFVAENPSMGVVGGIQPGKFKQVFSDPDDVDGLAARILFSLPREINQKHNPGYCVLRDRLPHFFQSAEALNLGTVAISEEAYQLWRDKEKAARDEGCTCGNGALDAWLHKAAGHIGRLALQIHAIECIENPQKDRSVLSEETMRRAIVLWTYFKQCYEYVLNTGANSSNTQVLLTKVLDKATEMNGLTAREAYQYIGAIAKVAKDANRTPTAYANDLFSQLVQQGRGQMIQSGRTKKFMPLVCMTAKPVEEIPEEEYTPPEVEQSAPADQENPFEVPTPTPKEKPKEQENYFDDETIETLTALVEVATSTNADTKDRAAAIDKVFSWLPSGVRSQVKDIVMATFAAPPPAEKEPDPDLQEALDLEESRSPW
jgi:Protein of unknown function (DUF3987)